ncbi:MAG TPA: hypothetical protein VJL89_03300 [Thermodesulfovibrionia bacterium]|nr:hypothetical protein [Thermodesulfovibrionia bacterium]
MSNLTPLTETEARQLVTDWYVKLDVHAPMVEILPLLDDEELEMQFPETILHGYVEFETQWYQRVIRTFFDEVHELKELNINISNDRADIKLVVKWEASIWNPPAAKSERIIMDASQTWVVKRSPKSQKPVIVNYIVNSLNYYEGSARL